MTKQQNNNYTEQGCVIIFIVCIVALYLIGSSKSPNTKNIQNYEKNYIDGRLENEFPNWSDNERIQAKQAIEKFHEANKYRPQ